MGEWRETTLDNIGRIVTGKTPSSQLSDCFEGHIPFVTPSDMDNRRLINRTHRYLTDDGAKAVASSRIPANAVMVSCIGSDMGKAALSGQNCITNQQINSIIVDDGNEPLFVYYNLKMRKEEIRATAGGSAVPILKKSSFGQLQIALPPLPEQRAIAHILGTLDDKIELNRRMNETLEAMARALFKSWFVDFDPVRAKAESRDSGLPKHIADLFPDSFNDSELGEIPEGWRVKPIDDLADVVGGGTPSTKEPRYWEGGTHYWATPKDLSILSDPVLLGTDRRITDEGLEQVSSGLLPKGTVLLSSRAPIGYLVITEIPVAINQGFIAMKAKKGVSNLFLLFWASVAHDEIVSRANGSTFLEISKTNFRPIPVVTPSDGTMQKLEQLIRPLYARIVETARECRTLSTLRDTLLLKLISGELRVKDAESPAEATA